MFDLLIRNGTVVDGTGSDRFTADVAITDGVIVAVGSNLEGEAREVIDATGLLVTPGFVDVHTHYDGQVTWDETLEPTSLHGVTTLVMGNCGVGFAPVKPGTEDWLIQLMEGVEDIPGAALSEGIEWDWETFPEYLDALEQRRWSVDVGTQIPHGSVRAYVMGERGARNEDASPPEIEAMAEIVQEAVEAGALGVSTSRTIGHRAMDGEPVPGTFAAEDELFALGRALRDGGGGVFELAPAGAAGLDLVAPMREVDWMRRLSAETGQPVTFAMLQVPGAPDLWKEQMAASLAATEEGARLYPQVAGRPFGVLVGFQTGHPFMLRPTYQALAHLPIEERVAELQRPEVRAAILSEENAERQGSVHEGVAMLVAGMLHNLYVLGDPPNYEPTLERSVGAIAEVTGVSAEEVAYDAFLAEDGKALLMAPLYNYVDSNHDVIREQLTHPQAVVGLGDGGAHCGLICDASLPTTMISHWTRDRHRGEQLPLEWVVRKQTKDTAELFGMGDRGTIEVGRRGDINIIDHDKINLRTPELVHDLPAGGRRLIQKAEGYVATIVAGEITRKQGEDTGARPGRLVRGRR